jgi:hypothetical protein
MNGRWIAVPVVVRARVLAACIFGLIVLAPCWTKLAADTGPAQKGPAETAPPPPAAGSQAPPAAHHEPAPPPVQAGMRVERQVVTPSGNLRIEYMRDRQKGIRQIALQDAHNPANTAVLAKYKRNAWVVVSPNDEWVVLNNRDGAESGAQLYHRVSTAPLKYEIPEGLRANGGALQDVVWQSYLGDTQQAADTDRSRVTIDGIAWEPDSHKISVSVAPIATKDDTALPEPWTCTYDVTTKQIQPPPAVAGGPANEPGNGTPNESADAQSETDVAATDGVEASPPAEEPTEMEGEKFPATKEEPITVADANELELSDIRYAINEMLARHGVNFRDAKIKKTFSEFSWYQPRTDVAPDEIEKTEFSDVEKHNIAVLRRCRDAKVAAARRPERRAIRGEPVDQESEGDRAVRSLLQGVSDAVNGTNP